MIHRSFEEDFAHVMATDAGDAMTRELVGPIPAERLSYKQLLGLLGGQEFLDWCGCTPIPLTSKQGVRLKLPYPKNPKGLYVCPTAASHVMIRQNLAMPQWIEVVTYYNEDPSGKTMPVPVQRGVSMSHDPAILRKVFNQVCGSLRLDWVPD